MKRQNDIDVKEKILDASIKLFLVNGFAGTSMKQLTDAVGVARGTVYWHFESKDRILEEVLNKFSRELYDVVFEKVNSYDGDFIGKFKLLYRLITEFARDKRELLLVANTVMGEIAGTSSNAERQIKEMQMRFHDFLKALLDAGKREGSVRGDLDTNLQAHILIACFTGMHLEWCLQGDSFDAVEYVRLFRESMLRGLGAEK